LVTCKRIANELAAAKNQPINPVAIKLGLSEPDIAYQGIEQGTNPAEHYYSHLLVLAEKLFEGELDAMAFEEGLRVMFGTKAYIMFTLDKVIAAIIKQVSFSSRFIVIKLTSRFKRLSQT
jgi:paired amphipathic helix protein Sin3a